MIESCIITVAGKGSRMAPITKIITKSMLPVVNIPALELILEELSLASIKKCYLIINKGDLMPYNYFGTNYKKMELKYITQEKQEGLAKAIYCAKKFLQNEVFLVALGDNIINYKSTIALIDKYNKIKTPVAMVNEFSDDQIKEYGKCLIENEKIVKIYEKDKTNKIDLHFGLCGRYIVDSKIFSYIEKNNNNCEELLFTDILLMYPILYSYKNLEKFYDIGSFEGYKSLLNDYINSNIF